MELNISTLESLIYLIKLGVPNLWWSDDVKKPKGFYIAPYLNSKLTPGDIVGAAKVGIEEADDLIEYVNQALSGNRYNVKITDPRKITHMNKTIQHANAYKRLFGQIIRKGGITESFFRTFERAINEVVAR